MRTISIMNNKGGVGKTVTAINLADVLVRRHKKRVVLVDCDGQMNLTRFYLPKFDPETQVTVADILRGEGEPLWSENLMPIAPDLDLLCGSNGLYDLDLKAIRDGVGSPELLGQFCEAAAEDDGADFFILDCPPGYTTASVAALMAADEVVIPMTVDGFAFDGVQDMQKQIASLQRARMGVKISGVLITQWHNSDVVLQGEQLLRSMSVPVFKRVIRRTEKMPESTFERLPVGRYSPRSAASRDYRAWVRELIGEV